MKRSPAFRPSVAPLEDRSMLSTIYPDTVRNAQQASYVVQATKADSPVIFIGDSITYKWGVEGSAVFSKNFAPLGAVNFGISGDTTANVIARVQGGDLAGKPKVAVVMIGINDIGDGETPSQAATGVLGVLRSIQAASPRTTILLLGVLPTGLPTLNPGVQQLDNRIAAFGKLPGVIYENPGAQFAGANEAARSDLLTDQVHPDEAGYALIAGAIDSTVIKLLQGANLATVTATAPRPIAKLAVPLNPEAPATDPHAGLFIPPAPAPHASTDLVAISTPTQTKAKTYATELINVSPT